MQEKSTVLLALVVVLNILETRSQQTMQEKNSPILLARVVVLNILETRSQQTMQEKAPFC